ncbi:MAG: ABC transporter permease [Tannerella sp.]|jgi:ABC-type antimicrobial peptide transport system permease subunit|nr:ABC transporter permease [Tannerella sp.]
MNLFFFNIIWRNLTKRSVFPIINIAGLSIGLAVVLLIGLLIFNEWSFDRSFRESKNIYRINSVLTKYMPGVTNCATNNFVGPAVEAAIPEVLATVRTYSRSYAARVNDHSFRIRVIWADEAFFRLFDTPFLQGSPEAAMSRPNVIAISEKMAQTLFGNSSPLGETFLLDNQHPMEVAAVYKDFPVNSSVHEFQMIAPYPYCYPATRLRQTFDWEDTDYETFCLLTARADTAHVGAQIRKVVSDLMGEEAFFVPALQRLEDIHLYSSNYTRSISSSPSDIEKVKTLSLLAIIILLVACINYMNLSTARAQKRSKEIGVCKTLGAKRGVLIVRLFFETAILTLLSFMVAFLLAFFLLPVFNFLLGEQLHYKLALSPVFLLGALLIWIITTVFASSYPAIYLSGFPPLKAIRQGISSGMSGHAAVRKILTIGQFSVAIILIAWTIIIQSQMRYINSKDIGFDPHNLIGIPASLPEGSNIEALLNDYRAQSSVVEATRAHRFLFGGSRNILKKNVDDRQGIRMLTLNADPGFTGFMQLQLIAGKSLPVRHPGDSITQLIVNRKTTEYLSLTPDEIIGRRILVDLAESPAEVCGVVENFNFESLHSSVEPYGIYNGRRERSTIVLRVQAGNLPEQLITYEEILKRHFPNELFEPVFSGLELEKAYEDDRRTNRVAIVFSVLSILVACMGVFGLTAFMAEQRKKEIGIRKVLGASVIDIVSLFTANYVKILGISLVIAIPTAWWVGNLYLQNFAYRISLSWCMFAAAALITVALTLLTVSVQAIRAATANPVKAISSSE